MSTAKRFAKQTAIYGFSTIFQRLLSSLLTPLYTRAYQPKVYSIFSTMFSYASILQAILAFGMETTFFRFLNKFPDKKKQVYSNGFWVVFSATIIFLTGTVPFAHSLAGLIKIGNDTSQKQFELYIKYFIAILTFDAWSAIPFARLRAEGKALKYATIKFINIGITVLLNVILIVGIPFWIKHHYFGSHWLGSWYVHGWIGYVFAANLIATFITFLTLLPQLLQLQLKLDIPIFKDMLIYSTPVLVANLSYLINENLDKILLGKLLPGNVSEQQVGVYSACARLSIFLSIFNQAFRMGAEPFFFSHAKNKNAGQTYSRIMDYFVITMCLMFVGIIANIEILKYYINKSYWVGLDVVPPLLFGYVSLGIYMNLSVWYKLSDQTRYGLYISGIGAIVTILLNVAFIPRYSYMASAWASFFAYSTMMILSYILGQKNHPIPYHTKKNLTYILLSILLVYLSAYVFHRNIYIGNLLFFLFAFIAYYFEWGRLRAMLFRKET
ncbi:oligosaccharide flippase family protein [Flavitalea sp. BT771]|uniref:oligosaccharide flippase family protein n=1 Tax=Flavitalea sp. BT771 TaxID=3063329 RepID=UPI0026E130F0|nr:polysaccharide biosynthesis C-terminal domain-containing protein [Flavitalea sp. BT771]MDO6429373.1 oligosaccharide flippase family protein [Flavitalea sp. BT771]MDV6218499.1 oligosaccharide flippase family protein [Flavitalea sp. BT771]